MPSCTCGPEAGDLHEDQGVEYVYGLSWSTLPEGDQGPDYSTLGDTEPAPEEVFGKGFRIRVGSREKQIELESGAIWESYATHFTHGTSISSRCQSRLEHVSAMQRTLVGHRPLPKAACLKIASNLLLQRDYHSVGGLAAGSSSLTAPEMACGHTQPAAPGAAPLCPYPELVAGGHYETAILVGGGFIAGGGHVSTDNERDTFHRIKQQLYRKLGDGDFSIVSLAQDSLSSPKSPPGSTGLEGEGNRFLRFLRGLHRQLLADCGVDRDAVTTPGEWRKRPVRIIGSTWCPPQAPELPVLLVHFTEWFGSRGTEIKELKDDQERGEQAIVFAAQAHANFVYLHPFGDGNGRISRLLMNMVLLDFGFPPVVIDKATKSRFCCTLDDGFHGNLEPFVMLLCDQLEGDFDAYFSEIPGAPGELEELEESLHQPEASPDQLSGLFDF